MSHFTPADDALLRLLRALEAADYAFVTPTPETHARNLARRSGGSAQDLRDVFGWSLPLVPGALPPDIEALLRAADAVGVVDGRERSAVRVSSLDGRLFLHSAYPTTDEDSVFFGPDSYRFACLIRDELAARDPRRLIDIGTGSGVGALTAAAVCPGAEVVMTDVNAKALRLARINAAAAGVSATFVQGSGVEPVEGGFDLALLNPPYIADDGQRQYRDGGALHGGQLSLDLSLAIVERLDPGGRLILYTGSAVVDGRHALREELGRRLPGCSVDWRELDPDVFGEELDRPAYAHVERISVVAAVIDKPPASRLPGSAQ